MRRLLVPLACLALLGCQPLPPPQYATLTPNVPPGQFAPDQTDRAILTAWDTFTLGHHLQGDPARVARSVAYIEFLSDDFRTMRWFTAPPSAAVQLLIAQRELRAFLDIDADARTQPVINAMLAAADALRAGDRKKAEAALTGGPFHAPAATTLARLDAMPRMASVAAGANLAWVARFEPRLGSDCLFPC